MLDFRFLFQPSPLAYSRWPVNYIHTHLCVQFKRNVCRFSPCLRRFAVTESLRLAPNANCSFAIFNCSFGTQILFPFFLVLYFIPFARRYVCMVCYIMIPSYYILHFLQIPHLFISKSLKSTFYLLIKKNIVFYFPHTILCKQYTYVCMYTVVFSFLQFSLFSYFAKWLFHQVCLIAVLLLILFLLSFLLIAQLIFRVGYFLKI